MLCVGVMGLGERARRLAGAAGRAAAGAMAVSLAFVPIYALLYERTQRPLGAALFALTICAAGYLAARELRARAAAPRRAMEAAAARGRLRLATMPQAEALALLLAQFDKKAVSGKRFALCQREGGPTADDVYAMLRLRPVPEGTPVLLCLGPTRAEAAEAAERCGVRLCCAERMRPQLAALAPPEGAPQGGRARRGRPVIRASFACMAASAYLLAMYVVFGGARFAVPGIALALACTALAPQKGDEQPPF